MKVYKHLFFDLDHTIWDFETNAKHALEQTYDCHGLAERGIGPFETFFERYSIHNAMLWDRYTKGLIRQNLLKWKRMYLTILDFKIADQPLAERMSEDFLARLPLCKQLFPYTFEILDYLKAKDYRLHLITNGFIKTQTQKLENSGLTPYFEEMITSEASGSLKPNPAIFAFAIDITGAELKKSIMIGDNLIADIKGAKDFGLDTVFINHINCATPHGATYAVKHLKELEDIF